ncbi:MAG: phosphatidylglycerol lysyltransferase domain-containing protein [Parachlamydiaceae bacterium]
METSKQNENDQSQFTHLVRRWGGLTTDALLDPRCQHFERSEIEGFIGYRVEYDCAIVFGDPVCSSVDTLQLAQAFQEFCKTKYKNIIYLTASETFVKSANQKVCKAFIEYGEEVFLDPHVNPKDRQGTHASLVRRKMRHAQKNNVTVSEYLPYDSIMEKNIENVGIEWLNSRKGPQIHISNVHLFDHRMGKRWFYAKKEDQIIGVVVLNQLHARKGWHMNHLMFTPDAPNGTPELLVVSVIEILKHEDCPFISFGFTPHDHLGNIHGLSSFSAWMARQSYKLANHFFHLGGHKMFWGKFHPETKPSYIAFSNPKIGWREILALMRAMNASISS